MTNEKKDDIFFGISGLLDGQLKVVPRSRGRVSLDKAPNQVVFIESPKFLDGPELHEPQFCVVRDFFELLCPMCNDIERIMTTNDVPRKDQLLLEFNVCPVCGYDRRKNSGMYRTYNEMIGVVGMRGGKSVLASCMSAAIVHELLCVDKLQERLGLVRSQEIDGAFVAASGEQASETIYGNFRGFYDASPWFQAYKNKLMDLEILDPDLRRGDLYWQTANSIHFKDKHIRLKSLTSNSGTIAGKTRIFAVMDELSRMDGGASRRSATEVYRVLKRSLVTIRASVERLRKRGIYDVPDARMFCISSPLFDDDKAMQLLKDAEKNDKMFAFHKATWEFNPDITQEDLAEEYASDELGAERDYGANPPGAENPFVKNPAIIDLSIDKERKSLFTLSETFFKEQLEEYEFSYVKPKVLDVKYSNLAEYVIHCDPGQKNDSFCLAIGHFGEDDVIVDGSIECRPIPKNNRQGLDPCEVYFPAMVEVILELAKKLTIKYVSYDRWNSTDQIQRLRTAGILAFQKNFSRDDHVFFLNSMIEGRIRFPAREDDVGDPFIRRNMPCSKALKELKKLNDDGVKVDHPPGGHNDMIQCYIGVHRLLMRPDTIITQNELREMNKSRRPMKKRGTVGRFLPLRPKGFGLQ